ncbi:MAG: DUF3786 domain-containing protein [Eubacteriales bacterium]|nr:DUF3786 domain-containing protein [Eubacteriales bacterium]
MALSNYEITRNKMRGEFLKYEQAPFIKKFSLKCDDDYIYIDFVGRPYRIHRHTGVVEWSADHFQSSVEADYNESLTIYDILCYSREHLSLSGRFCPVNQLPGAISFSSLGNEFYQSFADSLKGRTKELSRACCRLGKPADMVGDVSAVLYPFSFLPVTLQYWEGDDEFPACIKFMFDENTLDYMHFETTFYMVSHLVERLKELMAEEN